MYHFNGRIQHDDRDFVFQQARPDCAPHHTEDRTMDSRLHPKDLTPQVLSEWLASRKTKLNARDVLRFDGLDRIVNEIQAILHNNNAN